MKLIYTNQLTKLGQRTLIANKASLVSTPDLKPNCVFPTRSSNFTQILMWIMERNSFSTWITKLTVRYSVHFLALGFFGKVMNVDFNHFRYYRCCWKEMSMSPRIHILLVLGSIHEYCLVLEVYRFLLFSVHFDYFTSSGKHLFYVVSPNIMFRLIVSKQLSVFVHQRTMHEQHILLWTHFKSN